METVPQTGLSATPGTNKRPLPAHYRHSIRFHSIPFDWQVNPFQETGTSEMLEELKEESIVNKVGGRFKLSTLIQKRMVQLNAGSRALVEIDTKDKMEIVLQEIIQDKIFLDGSNEIQIATGEDVLDLSTLEPGGM